MCLRIPGTAGIEALEVEAGVKPLCIRREEFAVRQAERIMMKTDNTPIKMSWDSFIENDQTERKMSPFGKMNIQVADISTNTDISLHSLGKEFNFLESLQPTKISRILAKSRLIENKNSRTIKNIERNNRWTYGQM